MAVLANAMTVSPDMQATLATSQPASEFCTMPIETRLKVYTYLSAELYLPSIRRLETSTQEVAAKGIGNRAFIMVRV